MGPESHHTSDGSGTGCLLVKITHLGQDCLKLRFSVSQHRRNSVKRKVMGRRQMYEYRRLLRDTSRQAGRLCPRTEWKFAFV